MLNPLQSGLWHVVRSTLHLCFAFKETQREIPSPFGLQSEQGGGGNGGFMCLWAGASVLGPSNVRAWEGPLKVSRDILD